MNFKTFIKNKLFGGLILIAFLVLGFYFLSLFLVKLPKTTDNNTGAVLNPPAEFQSKPEAAPEINTSTPPLPQEQVKFEGFEGLQEELQLIEEVPDL